MGNYTYEYASSLDTDISPVSSIYINEINMSKRLLNVLERNKVYNLSSLSQYPYEKIMRLRNMGAKTYAELKELCAKLNIPLQDPAIIPPIPDHLRETGLPLIFLSECTKNGFLSLEDLNGISTYDLSCMCNNNYILTQQIYQSLLKFGITFKPWENSYLFEHLPTRYAMRLWECFHITTVSQLLAMDMKTISGARGVGKKGVKEIDCFRKTFIEP